MFRHRLMKHQKDSLYPKNHCVNWQSQLIIYQIDLHLSLKLWLSLQSKMAAHLLNFITELAASDNYIW
jgi:hypothetical protein